MDPFFYENKHEIGADYFKVEQGRDFSFPMHMHRCYELIYVLEGSMEVRIERETYPVSAGEMILIKPNRMHDLRTSKASRHKLCIFSPELIAAVSGKLTKYRLPSPVLREIPNPHRELFLRVAEDATTAEIKGVLYCLSDLYCRTLDITDEDVSSGNDHLMRNVFLYIENNMHLSCTLEGVAGALGYSASYLSRAFKAAVGISFKSYVRKIKINYACYLLENTEEHITDVVSRCGYASVVTFNHCFKEQVGCSPTEYRRSKRR